MLRTLQVLAGIAILAPMGFAQSVEKTPVFEASDIHASGPTSLQGINGSIEARRARRARRENRRVREPTAAISPSSVSPWFKWPSSPRLDARDLHVDLGGTLEF